MKYLSLVLIATFLTASIGAQSEPPLTIPGFYGLDTRSSDQDIKPEKGRQAINIDFARYGVGTAGKRLGYSAISTKTGVDSIIYMGSLTTNQSRSALFFVVKDSTKDYGSIWLTPWGSDRIDSAVKVWDKWPTTVYPSFTTFQDRIVGVNSTGRGVVLDDKHQSEFPTRAPGELRITPLQRQGGLNGIYRYTIVCAKSRNNFSDPIRISNVPDYISQPIRVSNGAVELSGFQWPPLDSADASAGPFTGIIGPRFYIYRTLGDRYPLSTNDKFYWTGIVVSETTPNAVAALSATDTISDAQMLSLADTASNGFVALDRRMLGRGTTRPDTVRAFAPGFKEAFSGTALLRGLSRADSLSIKGLYYNMSYVDTTIGLPGDTGRGLLVAMSIADPLIGGYKIYLPAGDSTTVNRVVNLYRGFARSASNDSISIPVYHWVLHCSNVDGTANDVRWTTLTPTIPSYRCNNSVPILEAIGHTYTKQTDSLRVFESRLIGTYKLKQDTVTIVTDSIPPDSLQRCPFYRQNQQPYLPEIVATDGSLLLMSSGSLIYWSDADSLGGWNIFQSQRAGNNDGDKITAYFSARTAGRVFKNRTNFNRYGDDKLELVGNYGIVAPRSVIHSINGNYFVSDAGVVAENEGQTLERTFDHPLLSQDLDNFTKMSLGTKSKVVGLYSPADRLALFSVRFGTSDTTYAFFEKSNAWATWTIGMAGGCIYDTGNVVPNSLYFFKPGGRTVYKYGSSEIDNAGAADSAAFTFSYTSAPLLVGTDLKKVDRSVLWNHSGGATDTIALSFIDPSGLTIGSVSIDSLNQRARGFHVDCNPVQYFQFRINSGLNYPGSFDRIDIYWRKFENYQFR